MSPPLTVMLVAAEASGDDRGAGLARALRARLGAGVRFVGAGGAGMAAEGVQSPFDISEISVLGLIEGLMAYPKIRRRVRDTVALAAREKPDVAILIDSWGFTLRVAHGLRRLAPDLPLIKYVAPQVWATRPGRAKTLARSVDLLLSINAFDGSWFEAEGLPVEMVGNSALSLDLTKADPMRLRARIGAGPDDPVLLVAPGSRSTEISRLLPVFEQAVARLKVSHPALRVVIPAAPTVAERVKDGAGAWATVLEGQEAKLDALAAATVALACSGTVTAEIALAGAPVVVGYKVAPVTYHLLKALIRTRYITLFNIAAEDFVAPEFIQGACEPEGLARAVAERLDDPTLRERQVARQYEALERLGRGGRDPSEVAADAVLDFLRRRDNRNLGRG